MRHDTLQRGLSATAARGVALEGRPPIFRATHCATEDGLRAGENGHRIVLEGAAQAAPLQKEDEIAEQSQTTAQSRPA